MISVMSNATLEFSKDGQTVKAEIGFNRLPDWVAGTDYFKLCTSGITPLVTQFEGSSDKALNEAEALRLENLALKEKLREQSEKEEDNEQSEPAEKHERKPRGSNSAK